MQITLLEGLAWLCGVVLAVAGAINVLGTAAEKIAKVRQAIKAPDQAQDDELAALRRELADVKDRLSKAEKKLENDNNQFEAIHADLHISHMAQLALLDHALHGNNVKEMEEARDSLFRYLSKK